MKHTLHAAEAQLEQPPLRGVLVDERESVFDGVEDDFYDMARLRRGFAARLGAKIAVLVSDDLHYGLAEVSAGIHVKYGIDLVPFRDEAKALAWLTGRGSDVCAEQLKPG
jgi:hypothetical protein